MTLLIKNARVVTLAAGPRPRRGKDLRELAVMPRADVLIDRHEIIDCAEHIEARADRTLDAAGRVIMPGFVDCHTHACWAGDRIAEWEERLAGATYLAILAKGGGIMSTVRAVRAASQDDLTRSLITRLDRMLAAGATTIEVKSGYGITTADELKMLEAARAAAPAFRGTLRATALLGHALDPEQPNLINTTINDTLPEVSKAFPGIAIDAYCEKGAWDLAACQRLFEAAAKAGHSCRVHADQFNSLGMTPWAARHNFRSVDHLEASTPADLDALAASDTAGVMLPICGLHLDDRYAPGRKFIDAGGIPALATNCNPGSAPSVSIPLAIALAVRKCGLTPAEAITAATVNAAWVLRMTDRGTIAPGQRADVIMLASSDERSLAFELGGSPVEGVIAGGSVVRWPD